MLASTIVHMYLLDMVYVIHMYLLDMVYVIHMYLLDMVYVIHMYTRLYLGGQGKAFPPP